MLRKVFRTGNSLVISLPREALEYLYVYKGVKVEMNLDRENRQVILKPVEKCWLEQAWMRVLLSRSRNLLSNIAPGIRKTCQIEDAFPPQPAWFSRFLSPKLSAARQVG